MCDEERHQSICVESLSNCGKISDQEHCVGVLLAQENYHYTVQVTVMWYLQKLHTVCVTFQDIEFNTYLYKYLYKYTFCSKTILHLILKLTHNLSNCK